MREWFPEEVRVFCDNRSLTRGSDVGDVEIDSNEYIVRTWSLIRLATVERKRSCLLLEDECPSVSFGDGFLAGDAG